MRTRVELEAAFREVGLRAGEVVLVHSSLRRLGPVQGGAGAVIEALLNVVGPEGTLAMPTHTFKVVREGQPVFHQALTPSGVGALTEVFRQRPGVVRGLHPTHSVAATGRRAEEFVVVREEDETSCPPESPYGRLRKWGGKVLIIGPGLECCTFFHGCEEWAGMPWAGASPAVQLYSITVEGRVVSVKMCPNNYRTWDQYPRLEPGLLAAGAMKTGRIGGCSLRLLDAAAAAGWLIPLLQRDPTVIMPENGEARP